MATPFPIRGFVPAVPTPFDRDGRLMIEAFAELIAWLAGIGADGICIAGDNGESWALSPDERRILLRTARDRLGPDFPLILGASATSGKQAAVYAGIAADEGATAILIMPQPYVLKASRAELLAHYEHVARSASLPIIAYNSPRRSGIVLTVDDLEALCGAVPVIGLKESTRDVPHLTRVVERLGQRIAVLTGPANSILWTCALGAAGFIATGPELLGPTAAHLMGMARSAPDETYRQTQFRLNAIYEGLMGTGTWPAALKAAYRYLGLPAGVPREPVMDLSAAQSESLHRLLAEACVSRLDGK